MHSPWMSAVVVVKIKNSELRFSIDLRRPNNRTVTDSYSIPKTEKKLNCL